MKQGTNNEIDLLLRRLSRRESASAPDGDLRAGSDHLDADELSSYAENVLPSAARARYTVHLAECSRCRELVVQLSSAAGVVLAEEPSRVSAPSGLRKLLASLFSPMVLRYAVPALGLAVVALIGFTIFRREQPRSTEMVATHRSAETPVVPQSPAAPEGFSDQQQKSGPPAATPDARGQRKEVQPSSPDAAPAGKVLADADTVAPAVTKADSQPLTTAAAPPPAKPAGTTADQARGQKPEAQTQEERERIAEASEADKAKNYNQPPAETKLHRADSRPAKSRAAVSQPTAGAGALASVRGDKDEKDRDDAETRSVAGRRFRKQGGVWIDTAYADGPTTSLTRGSEQYRGLVADEPAIKQISEQLDGQIIVVWKGRAYHIR
jgi:hypothetical protein